MQASAQPTWEKERLAQNSRIDVLKANERTMAEMLDVATIHKTEQQELLAAARLNVAEQDEKRNLVVAEVASLQSEVARLSATSAPTASEESYTVEQLQQAVSDTVTMAKGHFDTHLADQKISLENEQRLQSQNYEDRLAQWEETVQRWKEFSDGQAIDITWWERFGDAFPQQLESFELPDGAGQILAAPEPAAP